MNRIFPFLITALLIASAHAQSPLSISEARASQRAGTKLVDISYDITGGVPPYNVSLQGSSDGGITWTLPVTTLTGHVGSGVSAGFNRTITWNAGADWNAQVSANIRFRVNAVDSANPGGLNMVTVQGGTLAMSMGTVTVGTFQIGRYEVTWGEWKAVRADATARGYDIGNIGAGCADNHPVHSVNWYDVVKWCNLKSEIDGLTPVYTLSGATYKTGQSIPAQNLSASGYRLPTEAEWEFAARGGIHSTPTTYSGSNTIGDVAWYWDNASGATCNLANGRGTWPVGGKASNELGLHDMSGNVWEWCWDASGSFRRIRGGSWGSGANVWTVSSRNNGSPGNRYRSSGFRLARSSGN